MVRLGMVLADLTRSLDLALAADAHEHAARAYTNLATAPVRDIKSSSARSRYCRPLCTTLGFYDNVLMPDRRRKAPGVC